MKEVSARVGLPENCILPSSDPERTETHPPARKRPPQHVHVMLHTAHVITVRHVWGLSDSQRIFLIQIITLNTKQSVILA